MNDLSEEMVSLRREQFAEWMNQLVYFVRKTPALGSIYLLWDPKRCRALDEVDTFCRFSDGARSSILIEGPKGTGKSTTAVHVALEYAKTMAWLDFLKNGALPEANTWLSAWSVPDFFRLTSCIYGDDGRRAQAAIQQASKAQLLIMDDVGQEGGNQDAVAAFYSVINTRYAHRRPMIITTNILPTEWETYRGGALARCADRWHEACTWVALTGESQRRT